MSVWDVRSYTGWKSMLGAAGDPKFLGKGDFCKDLSGVVGIK